MPMSFCVQATSCTSTWIFTISPEMLCMYDWESWLGVGGFGLVVFSLVWFWLVLDTETKAALI